MATKSISINRAPVLTLWATVVAGRLGFERDEALTLGRAIWWCCWPPGGPTPSRGGS
jgi:hypothetical protein